MCLNEGFCMLIMREPLFKSLMLYRELGLWPLTPKFDRGTGLFLKLDMQHGAY